MGKVADDRAWRRVKSYAKVSAPRIRYFTGPEIHRLIEEAPDWFKPLIQAALLTGARWSELHKVRVRDVDLASGVIAFPETKSGRPRFVYLTRSEEQTSELQSLIRTSYDVFCLKKKK